HATLCGMLAVEIAVLNNPALQFGGAAFMAFYYWEDFVVGDEMRFGEHVVNEAEMLEFARAFDPQPIYADPRAAVDGPYAGLVASGWQMAGWCMRMLVDKV